MLHDRRPGTTSRGVARLAWSVFAVGVAIFSLAAWLSVRARAESDTLPFLPALLVFSGVGAVVASRRRENPLGWLMLSMSGLSLGILADAYAQYGLTRSPMAPGTAWAAWAFMVSIEVTFVPLVFILLLFPHGRLLSARWRAVAIAAVVLPVVGGVTTAISDVNFSAGGNFPGLRDPVQLVPRSALSPVYTAYESGVLVLILAAALSLVLRFRRSHGEEREQLKWIAFAGTLAAAGFILLASVPGLGQPVFAFILLVPLIAVAAGIAILRYRLYDIDVVINKTVVFSSLAAFITAVYVGIVVGLGAAIGQGTSRPNLGLSILATAVVALAFQPVRERVQRLANRMVYGTRATPYEVLSDFSHRMGEALANEDVLPRMARILADGTGAAETRVWLKVDSELRAVAAWPLEAGSVGDRAPISDGDPLVLPGGTASYPVRHRGDLLGALSLTKPAGERLTSAEDHLARDLAAGAGLVLRNVRLTEKLRFRLEELQASRRRIVAAADDVRRRLERNIHDGAQRRLVALGVKAGLAERVMGEDPARADEVLAQIETELGEALGDLRDLARGIYPPLLADQGLSAALMAQARKVSVPVEVLAHGVGRYSQDVEAAVYFCILEALQNVTKHAQALQVQVSLVADEGALTFMVRDDGVGFDIKATRTGTGTQGMGDRLSALGGELRIESAPRAGTTITGLIPIQEMETVA